MKSLRDFIFEHLNESEKEEESKTFTFSFKELPNAKETIESLVKMAEDKELDFESTEDSFTITLTRDICTNERSRIDGIQDVLQQFAEISRKDSKNASVESFAQLTHKFMDKVDEMVSFIDNAEKNDEDEKCDGNCDEE